MKRTHFSALNTIIGFSMMVCLLCFCKLASADFKLPDIDKKYVSIKINDPSRDAGYVVGDVLKRHIVLTIKKPYQLVAETLPIEGYEHRYRGQKVGVELLNIAHQADENNRRTVHTIDLAYQVFTTGKLAKPAALRGEYVKVRNLDTKKVVQYRIPAFSFRISPLSVFGAVKLKEEMYPRTPPLNLAPTTHYQKLYIALGALALALLGLLYIYGKYTWLPRMGAPFSRAYRKIQHVPNNSTGLQDAMQAMHTAFNQTAGQTVFSDAIDSFLNKHPKFIPAKTVIEGFFTASHAQFFQDQAANTDKAAILKLCKHLRDCERGLRPDLPKA